MTDYRRHRELGGTYFFTVAIAERRLDLLTRHISQLKEAFHLEQKIAPFSILALVILPDHLHTLWKLPPGDADYSNRWRRIKCSFSKNFPKNERVSNSRMKKGERGLWQRRFWEHTIRDENDLYRHLDYIHFNPVKHEYVRQVVDWPYSTFHSYVKRGIYPRDWCGNETTNDLYET